MSSHIRDTATRLRLNVLKGHDLDGYLFFDEDHARKWLTGVPEGRYTVSLIEVRYRKGCRNCGFRDHAITRVVWTKTATEFVATPDTREVVANV